MGTTVDNIVLRRLRRKQQWASKKAEERDKLIRMHERNLVSQWAKEQLRDKTHLDASKFEADRKKLVDHEKAVQFLGRIRCKSLLAYDSYGSLALTDNQLSRLQGKNWHTPKHLFRVSSAISCQKPPHYQATNGLDSKDIHVPAALCQKYDGNHTIADSLPNETKIIQKIGNRLMWYDHNSDPFLSWTPSMLFVLVLGTARRARGETFINISSVDTEQAERAKVLKKEFKVSRDNPKKRIDLGFDDDDDEARVKRDGNAQFYFAERLLRETNLRCWSGWRPREVSKLTSDWFMGEWLSHGIVLSEKGSFQAPLAELLGAGLYDLHEQLVTEDGEDMRSLYHRCVRARSLAFCVHDEPKLLTAEELQGNSNLAAFFVIEQERENAKDDPASVVPPLHIFLSILGLKKRVRKDHLFMETLHLARDACIALEFVPEIPAIPVWLADPDFDFDGQWLHEFPKLVKIKASRAGKSRGGDVPDFDKDGMALEVVVKRDGWVVRREWKDEGEEGDVEGEGEEAQSQGDGSIDLEGMASREDEGEAVHAEQDGVDEEMVVDAPDEERAGVEDEDEDEAEGGNEISDVQMSGGDFQALGSSISEGEATVSADDSSAEQKED